MNKLLEEILKSFDEKFDKPIREDIGRFFNTPTSRRTYFDNSDLTQFLKESLETAYRAGAEAVIEDIPDAEIDEASGDSASLIQLKQELKAKHLGENK